MNKTAGLVIVFLIFLSSAYCQISDPGFAKYLKDNRNFESLILLNNLDTGHLNKYQIDSLNFYTGWAYYNLQDLEKGIEKFSSVSDLSGFYNASRFFASWSGLYLEKPDMAKLLLGQINPSSKAEKELFLMLGTGIELMSRNVPNADSLASIAIRSNPIYGPQWDRMQIHSNRLKEFKPKSYGLAGLLSGILPGAGKIYTGQKGAGVSSLLTVGAMTAITIENGLKSGWKKWNTLTAATILSVFYIGNIYGSIVGVRVYRERFYNEVDRAILLDVNIPLRNIYR